MKPIICAVGLLILVAVGAGAFIWSGAYNVAADQPHWRLTEQLMATLRERSIAARQSEAGMPDLDDQSLVQAGAGNYEAMCEGCHLAPGGSATELSIGLYPAPPDLSKDDTEDPAEAFWSIKHGIKMSGMPAWGKSMDDASIWGMVAFIRKLPDMSADQYRELVESSGGHSHGGGDAAPEEAAKTHVHADGSQHEHKD
ncbi:MAG: cytochrome c [Steroidobacteraceae bacterium]